MPPDAYAPPVEVPPQSQQHQQPLYYAWDPQSQQGYVQNGVYYGPSTGPAFADPRAPSPVGFVVGGVYYPPGTAPAAVPQITAGYGYSPGGAPPVQRKMSSRDKTLITVAIIAYVLIMIGTGVAAFYNASNP